MLAAVETLDIIILLAYLLGMVGFGVWIGRKQKTAADFMLGSKDTPWWVILASIVATETSTVTFLSVPGIAYAAQGDMRFLQLPLGYILGRLVVVVVLLPRYFAGQMFTAYEVLDKRFGGSVKQAASAIFIITRTLGDGLRLLLSAVILHKMFPDQLPMEAAVVGLGVATIVYTFMGGMKAVLWTDLIQFVVYMLGAGVAFWLLLGKIEGGWDTLVQVGGETGRLQIFDLRVDFSEANLLWTGLLGGAVLAVGTHGVDQMLVQRYLSARNQRDAGLALGLSGPVVLLQFAFFLLIGVGLYVFYAQQGMGSEGKPWLAKDRAFADFIVAYVPVGVLGLVLGAVFSAAMSTLSSSLNSAATALVNDFLPLRGLDVDRRRFRAVRVFTIVFGILQILVGVLGKELDDSIIYSVLKIQGFTVGIILGVFLLGLISLWAGRKSALTGMCVGLAVITWVAFGTTIAWPWYALIGSMTTVVFGLLGSLIGLDGRPDKPPQELG